MSHLIGNTPLVQLSDNLFAKAEFLNLTGSVKDRAANCILDDAEARGLLSPGGTIIEATSGNTGISLAALAVPRGYHCIIVMPDSMSAERQQLMRAYGAEVVLTPGALGMQGSVDIAQKLASDIPGSFLPRQFENPANALAHYRSTGPEIWAQANGNVDFFVAGVGTGGTITGTARYLKEKNPNISIVAVEPAASPLLSAGNAGTHGIQGIGANFIPSILDTQLLDVIHTVTNEDAYATAKQLSQKHGLLCGISAGANVWAAARIAQANPTKTVVTLLPDSGMRYLSDPLFQA